MLRASMGVVLLLGAGCFDEPPLTEEDGSEGSGAATVAATASPDDGGATGDGADDDGAVDTTAADGDATTAADSGDEATTDDTSETGTTAACEDGGALCVPPAGPAWQGPLPVVVGANGSPPPCPDGAAELQLLGAELDAPAATCGCECGDPVPPLCEGGSASVEISFDPAVTCPFNGANESVPITSCVSAQDQDWAGLSVTSMLLPAFSGECPAMPTLELPPAAFGTSLRVCPGMELPGECLGPGLCVPPPPPDVGRVCMVQSGDHPCPLGYDDRILAFSGTSDTRSCSACSCGDASGSCNGIVRVYAQAGCVGGIVSNIPNESCDDSNMGASMAFVPLPTVASGCPPSLVQPMGDVTPTGPVTVCCLAPP